MNSALGLVEVYADGASRGNPGPAAIGYIVLDTQGKLLEQRGETVGIRTNNQAEYLAVDAALKAARRYTEERVVCSLDSQLVVRQLTGEYRIRNRELEALADRVREREGDFDEVEYRHVGRDHPRIETVDELANRALSEET